MKRKKDKLAEFDEQVKEVGASLVAAFEKGPGAAVFMFCGTGVGQGTTTIASAVSRAIAESGTRTVLAAGDGRADEAPSPSRSLLEVVEAGGNIAFDESRWARVVVPRQFLELPETARDPRSWLKAFDLMIIDAPPLTEFSTRYWVPRTHGVVLVVDGEKAGVGAVLKARSEIARLGGTFTGVVLNRYRSGLPNYLR